MYIWQIALKGHGMSQQILDLMEKEFYICTAL